MAFLLAMLLFSLAGIPPLAGFFAKFYVFLAAIEAGLYVARGDRRARQRGRRLLLSAHRQDHVFRRAGARGFEPMPAELRVVLGVPGVFILLLRPHRRPGRPAPRSGRQDLLLTAMAGGPRLAAAESGIPHRSPSLETSSPSRGACRWRGRRARRPLGHLAREQTAGRGRRGGRGTTGGGNLAASPSPGRPGRASARRDRLGFVAGRRAPRRRCHRSRSAPASRRSPRQPEVAERRLLPRPAEGRRHPGRARDRRLLLEAEPCERPRRGHRHRRQRASPLREPEPRTPPATSCRPGDRPSDAEASSRRSARRMADSAGGSGIAGAASRRSARAGCRAPPASASRSGVQIWPIASCDGSFETIDDDGRLVILPD